MIEFTVKTLDSQNHRFSVGDETTVEQLKELIRTRLGIEVCHQRLIFFGRVLQDDKKLSEIDLNGKVLHLVQRPPLRPGSPSPRPINSTSNASNIRDIPIAGIQQQIRRLMTLAGPAEFLLEHQHLAMSPTASRLELVRRMMAEIRSSLARLTAHVNNEPEPNIDENGEVIPENETLAQITRRRSYRAIRALRSRHARPRDLAQILDELNTLQIQFAPHRENYARLLRSVNNVEHIQLPEELRQREQIRVNMISDILHCFGHAYHTISDITFLIGSQNPRLTSDGLTPRHGIPVQAHINVLQSNRRPPQSQDSNAQQSSSATAAPPTEVSSDANRNGDVLNDQATGESSNNSPTPTVNVIADSDPITYQVEIEARVPIALPIENVMMSEMAHMAAVSTLQQHQNMMGRAQQQPNSEQVEATRRQVISDFDQFLRGLNPASGAAGVEVVMSMEEVPQSGTSNSGNTSSPQPSGSQRVASGAGVRIRRAPAPLRGTSMAAVSNVLYDLFLQCDSPHARRHVQARRERYQQLQQERDRLRAERTATQNIELLQERIPNMTQDHVTTMTRLLNSQQSPETLLNGFMMIVARHHYLSDSMEAHGSEPALMPLEFSTLRNRQRAYLEDLMARSESINMGNIFQSACDLLVNEQSEFIRNMGTITPVVPGVNLVGSIRALVRTRLPPVIVACIANTPSEVSVTRFYGVCARIFMDMCCFVSLICLEGVNGLRAVYRTYMEQVSQDFDESMRQLLIFLSNANLHAVVGHIRTHLNAVRGFVRLNDEFLTETPINLDEDDDDDESMEESVPYHVTFAEAQSTPPKTSGHVLHVDVPESANASNAEDDSTSSDTTLEIPSPPDTPEEPSVSECSPKNTQNATPEATTIEPSPSRSPAVNVESVSPVTTIRENWDDEWVPVLSNDQSTQNAEPTEPYSDAYLSGMPAKKRKCIRQERPPANLEGFINETTREASSQTTTTECPALRSAFVEHMRQMLQTRSENSEDYDLLRYVSTTKFLDSKKDDQKRSESDGDKNDP